MPTATNGTYFLVNVPFPTGKDTGGLTLRHTLTPSTSASDTYKVMKVGKGITFNDAYVSITDVDTNATPTLVFSLRVTDGTTTKILIDGSTAGQAGGLIRPTKVPTTETGLGFTTDNKDYWVDILWSTGAATAASGTCVVYLNMSGFYTAGAVTE